MDIYEILENVNFVNDYQALILPIILIVIDILTGVINACVKKELDSSVMRKGLGHKFSELVYLTLGVLAEIFFNWHQVYLLMIIYICLMELISIAENCTKLGFPVPKFLENLLKIKE